MKQGDSLSISYVMFIILVLTCMLDLFVFLKVNQYQCAGLFHVDRQKIFRKYNSFSETHISTRYVTPNPYKYTFFKIWQTAWIISYLHHLISHVLAEFFHITL